MSVQTGKCCCGGVAFEFDVPPSPATACHCTQCRKDSGHYWAAVHVPLTAFRLTSDTSLKWRQSSDWAKRGFCTECGASLFYQMDGEKSINIGAGMLDSPTGVVMKRHIFMADKGDYYEPTDALPKLDKF